MNGKGGGALDAHVKGIANRLVDALVHIVGDIDETGRKGSQVHRCVHTRLFVVPGGQSFEEGNGIPVARMLRLGGVKSFVHPPKRLRVLQSHAPGGPVGQPCLGMNALERQVLHHVLDQAGFNQFRPHPGQRLVGVAPAVRAMEVRILGHHDRCIGRAHERPAIICKTHLHRHMAGLRRYLLSHRLRDDIRRAPGRRRCFFHLLEGRRQFLFDDGPHLRIGCATGQEDQTRESEPTDPMKQCGGGMDAEHSRRSWRHGTASSRHGRRAGSRRDRMVGVRTAADDGSRNRPCGPVSHYI